MLNIIFKNVGQGDSIIIEWKDNNSNNKVGFIDCNLDKRKNPSLEHLQKASIKEIEFIILSHPHFDHFSGMKMLLDYCDTHNIIIHNFLHTSQTDPRHLASASKSAQSEKELGELFIKIKELFIKGGKQLIKRQTYINESLKELNLSGNIKLQFLAPTAHEYLNFNGRTYTEVIDVSSHSNPHGNWLSTFIKIYDADWYILLTSDLDPSVLVRLGTGYDNKKNILFDGKLLLAQSPHHGSDKNHSPTFWRNRNGGKVIFSAGEQKKYFHPGDEVVTFFTKKQYEIFSTNNCGALKSMPNPNVTLKRNLLSIARVTSPSNSFGSKLIGDQIFSISGNTIKYLGN